MTNREIVEKTYQDFSTGNVPSVLGAFAPDMSWTEAEGFLYGGTYVGADAILENVFMKLGTEWEGFAAIPEQIVDGGDTIVSLGNYSGKYLKTGKSMKVPYAHVWTVADGKITKFVQYTDTKVIADSIA